MKTDDGSENPENPRTVAVTGGTGFIGQHVLRGLAEAGWQIKALTRRATGLCKSDAVTPIVGTLDDVAALGELVSGADCVVHCAGLVAARSRREFQAVNVRGTANIAAAAAALDPAPRFILLSSLAAREPQLSPYASSKRMAETVLTEFGTRLDWRIVRAPVVYGPGDKATLPMFRLFKRGLMVRPLGSGRFSMIYVADLVSSIRFLLTETDISEAILELDDGREKGYGWDDLALEASRNFDGKIRTVRLPPSLLRTLASFNAGVTFFGGKPRIFSPGKVNEMAHPDWVCRNNLMQDLTPWRATTDLHEGFEKTKNWYVANGWL